MCAAQCTVPTFAISLQLWPASRICFSLCSSAGVHGVFVRLFFAFGSGTGVSASADAGADADADADAAGAVLLPAAPAVPETVAT